jgi:hypothetical protein
VVPNSQIDMVIRRTEGAVTRWDVCGDIHPEAGRAPGSIDLLVVVRQGDVVARGRAPVNFGRWRVTVVEDGDGRLTPGTSAIASAVAVVEEQGPPGLETLTWVQRVPVVTERGADKDITFPPPVLSKTEEGEVSAQRAVSSSLAIVEDAATGGARWKQVLEIREVVEASEGVAPRT